MVSALKLATPKNPTSSGTITIKWTNEPNDPCVFQFSVWGVTLLKFLPMYIHSDTWSFVLINQSFNNEFAIANNVNPSASQLTLTLPIVPTG